MKLMTSGVYVIKNTENGKFYIGSSAHVERRWRGHRSYLRRNVHDNDYLQNAWNKYGEDVFEFDIIVECGRDDLLWIEQVHLDRYRNDKILYNINTRVDRVEMTVETREKIRRAAVGREISEETRKKLSRAGKGQIRSQEFKERLRRTRQGSGNSFWGHTHTEEAKERIRVACRGEASPKSKLCNEDVWEIRRLHATGFFSCGQLGRMWRVTANNISYIVRRRNWSHI